MARQTVGQEPFAWCSPEHFAAVSATEKSVHIHGLSKPDERHTVPLYAAPPAQAVDLGLTAAFLSDVVTAAGLLSTGGQSKALARRISDEAYRLIEDGKAMRNG